MRRFFVVLFISAAAAAACAMDDRAVLAQADQLYESGCQPREALLLYQSIMNEGQDMVSVLLSKLKTAYIYEEQLFQYDEAIEAYYRFIGDYPDNRLTKIANSRVQQLEKIRTEGAVNEYREYKRLEKNYRNSPPELYTLPEKEKEYKRGVAWQLYNYAKTNCTLSFSAELSHEALSALIQQEFFFTAYNFTRFIRAHFPDADSFEEEVKEAIFEGILFAVARVFIGLCLLLMLIGRGFKPAYQTIRTHWKGLLIGIAVILFYQTLYIWISMKYNFNIGWNHLFFVLKQCLILIPVSILLSHSFYYLKNTLIRNITIGIVCTLLGISSWIVFADYFGVLFASRM